MTLSIFDAARDAPERVALVVGSRAVTFSELAARVARRIEWLATLGVDGTDLRPVALVGTSSADTLELLYALVEIGQPLALVHPRLAPEERRATAAVVSPQIYLELVPSLDALPDRAAAPLDALPERAAPPAANIEPERCLAVLFTSGTMGRPKGIVLSRRAFVASARASEANLGWRDDDRWLLGLPIAHVGGLSILARCLLSRRTVVVPEEVAAGQRLTAGALVRALQAERVTLLSLVPTQLEWLLSEHPSWQPPPHLRAVLLGGAAARPALLERAANRGVLVLTTYGLTEACSQVTTQPVGTLNRGQLGAGRPMAGVEVRLVDGAIHVRGPTLLSGYHPDVGSPLDADGWFATDDLGRFDEDGFLHILGRRSEVVITGGENVYPAEVEATLERCPGVAAACVFGVPDDTWGEIVAVALVASREGPAADGAVARFVREHLGQHRRPRLLAYVEAFAVTPAGKLDRAGTAASAAPALRRLHEA